MQLIGYGAVQFGAELKVRLFYNVDSLLVADV